MTDAPLSFITSPDGSSWSKAQNIVNGYSDYGLQMHVYRGELYGIMTQTVQYPKQMFATKYKIDSGWKSWRSLPENWFAQGRVSVTVLEDRFYILRRGTNDATYLCWTDDFETWVDVGRVGSKYASTMVAPAICAHDGKLYMTGVGPDNYIYYCIADKDGNRETSWTKIPGTGTQSALSMTIYDAKLWLFHTGWNSDKFFYQSLSGDGKSWSPLASVAGNVTSGLSAVSWKYNTLVVTFRGKDEDIKWNQFDGTSWMGKKYVPDVYMKYQTGLSTWGGRLVISYAAKSGAGKNRFGYQPAMIMSEKNGAFGSVKEVDEWDCKWDQNNKGEDKSWVKKMFCL